MLRRRWRQGSSYEQLDGGQGRVPVEKVDSLQVQAQGISGADEMMRRRADERVDLVALRLAVVERSSQNEALRRGIAGLDGRRLQDVEGAARRLLRVGASALQPLDAQRPQQLVLVQMRVVVDAIGLLGRERHPVDAVVGPEVEPLGVALVVEQARLADDEVDQLAFAWLGAGHGSMLIVMYR